MKFRLKRRVINTTDESLPEDRTVTLFFNEVLPQTGPGIQASTITLQVTEAESGDYAYNVDYTLGLTTE